MCLFLFLKQRLFEKKNLIINHKFVVQKMMVNVNNLLLFLNVQEYFVKLFLIHNNSFGLIQHVLILMNNIELFQYLMIDPRILLINDRFQQVNNYNDNYVDYIFI
jgi:hypothetical protein